MGKLAWALVLVAAPAVADPMFRVVDRAPSPAAPIAHTLFLNRCKGGCSITKSSFDDARRHLSSLPGTGSEFTLDELAWSEDDWASVMQCVREVYSPYAITVTDVEPAADTLYNEGVVGGISSELGLEGIAGISALSEDCSPYSNFISFIFGNTNPAANGDVDWLCWAIAHETAHAFGLDHAYMFTDGDSACRDPMSYRTDCGGQRFFRPEFAKCGEFAARDCKCGGTQSAHFQLLGVLGPGTPITSPPVASMVSPVANAVVHNDLTVLVDAGAQRGVATLDVYLNGTQWVRWTGGAWGPSGQPEQRYPIKIPDYVPDGIIDIVVDVRDDLGTSTLTQPITVTKGEPCVTADTCAKGQRCDAGRCLWDAPVGEFGDHCDYPQYCKSGMCADGGDLAICTTSCNTEIANSCPEGFECRANLPNNLCWPAEAGGCCSGSPDPAVLVGLALLAVRRRKFVPWGYSTARVRRAGSSSTASSG